MGSKTDQREAQRETGEWGVGEQAYRTLHTWVNMPSLLALYGKINREWGKKRRDVFKSKYLRMWPDLKTGGGGVSAEVAKSNETLFMEWA